jgi:hypothetical protein
VSTALLPQKEGCALESLRLGADAKKEFDGLLDNEDEYFEYTYTNTHRYIMFTTNIGFTHKKKHSLEHWNS